MKESGIMAAGLQEACDPSTPGIRVEFRADLSVIELNILRCGWAMGRLLFLLATSSVFGALAVFFLAASVQKNEASGAFGFAVMFFGIFAITLFACIAAMGTEKITITKDEFVFRKRVFGVYWQKRFPRSSIKSLALGRLSAPGEDSASLETVNLIYANKSNQGSRHLSVGYLLDSRYRTAVYTALSEILGETKEKQPILKSRMWAAKEPIGRENQGGTRPSG